MKARWLARSAFVLMLAAVAVLIGFGELGGLAMVIIMKKIVQPMISRGDDYYERNS